MQTVSEYNVGHQFAYNWKESRLKKCISIMESIPPGSLLDIGCSDGVWGQEWQRRGWKVSGIDVNPDQVKVAQKNGIDAHVCDLNRDTIPFQDNQFDLIFAGEVIEHLVDTDGFIADVRRVCKPGGRLLLTTPNLASFENRLRLVLGIYPNWLNYNLQGSGHVRGYTPRVLKRQLAEHGFRVTRHLGNWVPFIPQRYTDDVKMPFLSFTGTVWPSLAMDIIMLADRV
jgi:2-polyprenyl-3-methyl-5-hydroxy-6-metoxy-1,4-benzoquinol methylase